MSSTGASTYTTTSLLTRTGSNPNFSIKPSNNALHQDYTFYMRVRALTGSNGQSTAWHGPYYLYIGCTVNSVSFSDSPSLTT